MSTKNVEVGKAVKSGSEAVGKAVAAQLIKMVADQGNKLKGLFVKIAEIDQAGRTAFRVEMRKWLQERRDEVRASKDTPAYDLMKRALNSEGVRVSEATKFSEAIDAGYDPHWDDPYHALVSEARIFLSAKAGRTDEAGNPITGAGPTRKRGRTAKSFLDQVKTLALKETRTAEQLKLASELLAEMAINMDRAIKVSANIKAQVQAPAAAAVH